MTRSRGQTGLRKRHALQLYKTEMCAYFMQGHCDNGANCSYAHSKEEIQGKPDLTATSMCKAMLRTGVCSNPECRFAHAETELRATHGFYKMKICGFAKSGRCKHGSFCRFAHTLEELRPPLPLKRNSENDLLMALRMKNSDDLANTAGEELPFEKASPRSSAATPASTIAAGGSAGPPPMATFSRSGQVPRGGTGASAGSHGQGTHAMRSQRERREVRLGSDGFVGIPRSSQQRGANTSSRASGSTTETWSDLATRRDVDTDSSGGSSATEFPRSTDGSGSATGSRDSQSAGGQSGEPQNQQQQSQPQQSQEEQQGQMPQQHSQKESVQQQQQHQQQQIGQQQHQPQQQQHQQQQPQRQTRIRRVRMQQQQQQPQKEQQQQQEGLNEEDCSKFLFGQLEGQDQRAMPRRDALGSDAAEENSVRKTTLVVTNVPIFMTQGALLSMLEDLTPAIRGRWDFFYAPWDEEAQETLGYAVINFQEPHDATMFHQRWASQELCGGRRGQKTSGVAEGVLRVVWAALQGLEANIQYFSTVEIVRSTDLRFRPLARDPRQGGAPQPLLLNRGHHSGDQEEFSPLFGTWDDSLPAPQQLQPALRMGQQPWQPTAMQNQRQQHIRQQQKQHQQQQQQQQQQHQQQQHHQDQWPPQQQQRRQQMQRTQSQYQEQGPRQQQQPRRQQMQQMQQEMQPWQQYQQHPPRRGGRQQQSPNMRRMQDCMEQQKQQKVPEVPWPQVVCWGLVPAQQQQGQSQQQAVFGWPGDTVGPTPAMAFGGAADGSGQAQPVVAMPWGQADGGGMRLAGGGGGGGQGVGQVAQPMHGDGCGMMEGGITYANMPQVDQQHQQQFMQFVPFMGQPGMQASGAAVNGGSSQCGTPFDGMQPIVAMGGRWGDAGEVYSD